MENAAYPAAASSSSAAASSAPRDRRTRGSVIAHLPNYGTQVYHKCSRRFRETPMNEVRVRYIVDDVDTAAAFYRDVLRFELVVRPAPGFAMLRHGSLQLLLNAPGTGGGAGQTLSDGAAPQ